MPAVSLLYNLIVYYIEYDITAWIIALYIIDKGVLTENVLYKLFLSYFKRCIPMRMKSMFDS